MSKRKITDFFNQHPDSKLKKIGKKKKNLESLNESECGSEGLVKDPYTSVRYGTLTKWKKEFPWLRVETKNGGNDVMFCEVCRKSTLTTNEVGSVKKTRFIDGCTRYKHEALVQHDISKFHKESCKLKCIKENPSCSAILKQIHHMPDEMHKKMTFLFNTVYTVIDGNLSFSQYERLCQLQKKNEINLGETYLNHKACITFLNYIAEDIRRQQINILRNSQFIAIMSDSTTDVSVLESQIIYVTTVNEVGVVKSLFIKLQELKSGSAEGIFSAIEETMEEMDKNWRQKLVAICLDGTNVNFGKHNSVVTRLTNQCLNIITVHCVAHRLELAISDALKCIPFADKCTKLLKQIYKLYHKSPKLTKELKQVAEVHENQILKNTSVIEVRWIASKQQALRAVTTNLCTTVYHMESFCLNNENDPLKIAKMKGLLKQLTSVHMVRFLFFLLDITTSLAKLSLTFQKDNISIYTIKQHLFKTKLVLKDMTTKDGENLTKFEALYDKTTKTFNGILFNDDPKLQFIKDRKILCDKLIEHINERFDDIECHPILRNLNIFDPMNIPVAEGVSNEISIVDFGKKELNIILENLPASVKVNNEKIKEEYLDWKFWAVDKKAQDMKTLWDRLFNESKSSNEYNNLLIVISFLRCIPFSTSVCERGFSIMNLIKTDNRNKLKVETLNKTLMVKLAGIPIKDFDPNEAIKLWWEDVKSGTRHPDFLD